MAYKTAEERHYKQQRHEGSFSLKNKLMNYLRNNSDPAAADNQLESLKRIAANYDNKLGIVKPIDDYTEICQEVIDNYKNNWKFKEDGKDDRGNRLGKTYDCQKTISNVLQSLM